MKSKLMSTLYGGMPGMTVKMSDGSVYVVANDGSFRRTWNKVSRSQKRAQKARNRAIKRQLIKSGADPKSIQRLSYHTMTQFGPGTSPKP